MSNGIETEAGFSKVTTGFVMAGYFLGMFCGSLTVLAWSMSDMCACSARCPRWRRLRFSSLR